MKTLVETIKEALKNIFEPGYIDDNSSTSKRYRRLTFTHYCGNKTENLPDIEELESAVSEEDTEFGRDASFCGYWDERYTKTHHDVWEPTYSGDRYGSNRKTTKQIYDILKKQSKWFLMLRKEVNE